MLGIVFSLVSPLVGYQLVFHCFLIHIVILYSFETGFSMQSVWNGDFGEDLEIVFFFENRDRFKFCVNTKTDIRLIDIY